MISGNRALAVICLASFAAQIVMRITDPVLPQIAGDLNVAINSAALLATAFALPWALSQPVLGPAGDLLGKVRVIIAGMLLLTASTLAGAFAPDFTFLFASRIVSGVAAAAVSPVAFALAADLLSSQDRHVGIGRILFASISGQLVGAVFAGIVGDLIGWRGVLAAASAGLAIATALTVLGFRGVGERRADSLHLGRAIENYRAIFANPLAKVCYGAVFFEGIAVHGILPYVAPLLSAAGEQRATIAGFVVAGFAVGGASYAALVRPLIARFGQRRLMLAGGLIAAGSLLLQGFVPPWPLQALALTGIGFGFFMLHNGIQVQMLELAPQARGSSVAMHAFFLFIGQALGPVAYGRALPSLGPLGATAAAAAVMIAVAIVCARYLRGSSGPARTPPE